MHCEVIKDAEGKPFAIACHSGRRNRTVCRFCSRHWVSFLCDYPLSPKKTCDAGICEKCRVSVAEGRDYCPRHAIMDAPVEQFSLFGGQQT